MVDIPFDTLIGSFADPATEVSSNETNASHRVSITRNGEVLECVLDKIAGHVTVRTPTPERFASITSLIASYHFADLRSMADTQKRILKQISESAALPARFDTPDGTSGEAISHIQQLLLTPHSGTRVILIDGPAGIGKTQLIKRLVAQQAEGYLQGHGRPILYVASRGQRLANLSGTIAAASQALRTKFVYTDVATLVRIGLMVIAIDGFDELVDSDGYADAWTVLKDFLQQLGGAGDCILAGRDTFFDQQQFLSRLGAPSDDLHLEQLHLRPSSPEDARMWLAMNNWSNDDLDSSNTQDLLRSDSFALRPYFLAELATAGGWHSLRNVHNARRLLVDKFSAREGALIADSIALDPTIAGNGVVTLLEEVAMDMAERESDEIDTEYLTMLCELAFAQLPREQLKKLQHKVSSTAFLEQGTLQGMRRYPHTEIKHYYLAGGIARALRAGNIPRVLRRSILSIDFLETWIIAMEARPTRDSADTMQFLEHTLAKEPFSERLASNTAAILFSLLSVHSDAAAPTVPRQELSHVSIVEGVARGSCRSAFVNGVSFGRLDTCGASLEAIEFLDCNVAILVVDGVSRFGLTNPDVATLHDTSEGRILRDEKSISHWFSAHRKDQGENKEEPTALEVFFDRVCRRAIRQFYFRSGATDPAATILNDPQWAVVAAILDAEGFLERVQRPMGGGAGELIHIRSPRDLLAPPGQDGAPARIRKKIRMAGLERDRC
jgi:hypothetical protein